MFRGFYTVASGMLAQQRRTEMLTNNMSNANTPGFKADQAAMRSFPEMLLKHMGNKTLPTDNAMSIPNNRSIDGINTGVYMQEAMPSFIQGTLQATDNLTDVALSDLNLPQNSSVFFAVQHPSGEARYTRNGNFTIDGQGFLTTSSGNYVLNSEGNRINLTSDNFTISANGMITDNDTGVQTRLGVAYAENALRMVKEGDGLYRAENGATLPNAYNVVGGQFQIQQGFLERSNVDAGRTMTDMLTAYRAFEANQKVLQAYDRSMEKAANEVGKI